MLDFSNSKILIVGDVMLDKYYFGKVDRISPEAPVPIVNIQKEESRLVRLRFIVVIRQM